MAVRTVPSSGELPALTASTFPLHPRALGHCREREALLMPQQPWSRIIPGSCQTRLTSYKEVDTLEHLTRGA